MELRERKPAKSDRQNVDYRDGHRSAPPSFTRRLLLKLMKVTAGFFALLTVYVVLSPCPIDPVAMDLPPTLPVFEGPLAPNTKLQNAEKLLEGQIVGPESLEIDEKGNLYTGLSDGRVVRISTDLKVEELTQVGKKISTCGNPESEHICGRPLGLRFDKAKEYLYFLDSYFGLYRYHLTRKTTERLVDAFEGADGHPFAFLNDLDISEDGVIYFTDSSWKWQRRTNRYTVIEGSGQGRLLSYNLQTRTLSTLLSGLHFPNGVQLSPGEDFVLVSETTLARVLRFYIKGPKAGIYDLFSSNLPGLPDNIRPLKDGGYTVGLAGIRKAPFSLYDFIGRRPWLVSIIAKLIPQDMLIRTVPKYGLIVELNALGQIVNSWHDSTGGIPGVSEAVEDYERGLLYMGSYNSPFIARMKK